jgi:hypothetical protein
LMGGLRQQKVDNQLHLWYLQFCESHKPITLL